MPTDHERVLRAIEDRFYEENQLSDKTDIREATELSRNRLNSVIEELTGTGIVPVYHKESVSTVYATQQMVNSLAGAAGEPEWIED